MALRSIAVCLLTCASVFPQAAAPQLTPGSVVLLSGKDDADSISILKRAFLDTDPNVRATAARVAGVSTVPNLTDALVGAVAREQSPPVAAEMLRAVLLRAGTAAMGVARTQMKRIGAPAALVTAEWMARVQPDALLGDLADLVTNAGPSSFRLAPLVAVGARTHPDLATALLTTWMRVAPERGWGDALRGVITSTADVKALEPVLVDGLRSARANVREETVWTIVRLRNYDVDIPGDVLTEAARSSNAMSPWEIMGRDWIVRTTNSHAGTDQSRTLASEVSKHWSDLRELAEFSKLRPGERQILRAQGDFWTWRALAPRRDARTIDPATPTVLASAFGAAGCETRDNRAGRVEVVFAADGRPSRIDLIASGLSKGCQDAVVALARTSLAPADEPIDPRAVRTVIVPINDTFASCVTGDGWELAEDAPLPSSIAAPQQIRDVQPIYPPAAERARVQGVIIVDAKVSPEGCVRSAAVIRTIPELDVAALAAVTGWKYPPVVVDGAPRRVDMRLIVNFTLPPG